MNPVGLGKLLAKLPKNQDANLLVGFDTSDDAGVYRLRDDLAIVTTADFITPPVDDAYIFGQIAAANAISDVYAMGGTPVTCINLAGFPANKLPEEVLHEIVAGALSKITESGAVLAGGHTTRDDEPKFGLAVTGVVHPQKIWRNVGAQPGDALILTKPIGSGVIFNANLRGMVSQAALQSCIETLITLNKYAAEVFAEFPVHAVTDVTGFGLAGHAFEMASGSGVSFAIDLDQVPVMDEALEMYEKGVGTGVNIYNREIAGNIVFKKKREPWQEEILFDPQTSGGLLVALPADLADAALEKLRAKGIASARRIGSVHTKRAKDVHLVIQ